jgi:hypothetical protein
MTDRERCERIAALLMSTNPAATADKCVAWARELMETVDEVYGPNLGPGVRKCLAQGIAKHPWDGNRFLKSGLVPKDGAESEAWLKDDGFSLEPTLPGAGGFYLRLSMNHGDLGHACAACGAVPPTGTTIPGDWVEAHSNRKCVTK